MALNKCLPLPQVSVCDIGVHATDSQRLDLTIRHEQHYYLRAGSPQERQQWLIALGCAKQAAGKSRTNVTGERGEWEEEWVTAVF